MIKKIINKLLRRKLSIFGKRIEIPESSHGIDRSLVSENAIKVIQELKNSGYQAYIVGGAVRDLLLGLRPKDFDVATNATPEQVKSLFRRAFIIGRRFRLVHVIFGRGKNNDLIEVSTFRAYVDANLSKLQKIDENENFSVDLAIKSHAIDSNGRILRDNVWGTLEEDAARRDITINALYYDPLTGIIIDYHGGIKDIQQRILRIIGDPMLRYQEDPVRILRVIRFAAKLGFEIELKTQTPIKSAANLLKNMPQSRMFDEMFKLLQTGHAGASLDTLRQQGLQNGIFPLLDLVFGSMDQNSGFAKFIHLVFADTDNRVQSGKAVIPSFMLACMLWHKVLSQWNTLINTKELKLSSPQALKLAIDEIFNQRIIDLSGKGRLAVDMREIWAMQPRLQRRTPTNARVLVMQPRFRAALNFLRLRAESGETDIELAVWWEEFFIADEEKRKNLLFQVKHNISLSKNKIKL